MTGPAHLPVMLAEVMAALAILPGEHHVDATYGAGGYSRAMLAAGARVTAFDRDPDAVAAARAQPDDALTVIEAPFSRLIGHVEPGVNGIVFDIGVSSMQFDQAERGFSFQHDGPADMRMSQSGETAAAFLNSADEAEIARVIFEYGEEPKSRRIARAIVDARPITRTAALAAVVRRATGWRDGDKKDPATRTFQAIRIHINRELDELAEGLVAAEQALAPGGRLVVVSFHSLEDRIVKRFLRERSGSEPGASRHAPAVTLRPPAATFDHVARPRQASAAEVERNPRARSATLRSARRTTAPAWGLTQKGTS